MPGADEIIESLKRGRPAAGQDPAKRKQIVDGARQVFMRMGFDAASMNDITREAGVSKGTIYVYFANKEELFEALIDEERGAIFHDLYEGLERGGDLRRSLVNFGIALAAKITSAKVIMAQRTVLGATERIPDLGARFYERGPKIGHEKIVEFLQRAEAEGLLEMDDAELAAYQMADLSLAGVFRQCLFAYRPSPPGREEIGYIVESGVNMFLKAYGTEKLTELERGNAKAGSP